MNQFTIEKNTSGYKVNVKHSRLSFLKAFIAGSLTLEMDKDTASSVSNALYTPKVKKSTTSFTGFASTLKSTLTEEKPVRRESIASDEQVESTSKPAPKKRAPRKKSTLIAKADK